MDLRHTKTGRLSVWGSSLLNKLPSLSRKRRKREASKKRRVLLHTQVACNDCLLEMLCCTENSKEHESILWLRSKAFVVHSALLALKAEPGKPAVFTPEFVAPSGPKVDIFANWVDKEGRLQRIDAREWMRHSVHRYFSQPLASAPW